MSGEQLSDNLSRTVKLAMDTGEAATIQEAMQKFHGYHLAIEVGPDIGNSPTLQAALLTAVNTGHRCFLGGVHVAGRTDVPLRVPWRYCKSLAEAVRDLRGTLADKLPGGIPRIILGDVDHPTGTGDFAVRATFNGWSGGVIPLEDGDRLQEKAEFAPAGVLAGAIGVSEAFQHIRGGNPEAGRRGAGLSLWRPSSDVSWRQPENAGPPLMYLPSKLWVIGLGHLGQAFLWTLGLLPYAHPEDMTLVLQDFDFLTQSNVSTSLLTFCPVVPERKTRAIARFCEERGFRTLINERRFSGEFRTAADEPSVAIFAVDNALARTSLEDVGFSRIIEAGLGKGERDYLAFQVHTFPGPQKARERWGQLTEPRTLSSGAQKPAYEALARGGLDECGITLLAGRTVGASFVGAFCSALMVAESLRMVHSGPGYALVDGSLCSLGAHSAVENLEWRTPINPGITEATCNENGHPRSPFPPDWACEIPRELRMGTGALEDI